MSDGTVRVLYIPDWVSFHWCKEQEEHYHIFLQDYAEYHDEPIDHIKEEAGVKAYDLLKKLKDVGSTNMGGYSGTDVDMNSFIHYVLSDFIVATEACGSGSKDGRVINLNSKKYEEKLLKLIEKKGN